ncbi:MAG: NUDIX domain-containing protein [Ruminococcaceae bacterium]|nr:NUDIX domain-containing protein [Oscillospiraceae bacterium]
MLGKYVRVRVIKPMGAFDNKTGKVFQLNYGIVESGLDRRTPVKGAYIMGINHPVRSFEGRVTAVIKPKDRSGIYIVVSPKSKKFIVHEIKDAVSFMYGADEYDIECLYERSCGAVVFRFINGERRFLLIKNRRSTNWGFPKGHIEKGETREETAKREVLEETGLNIEIFEGFCHKSEYTIRNKIEKSVAIFLASTTDTQTKIQPEEIEDYIWLGYDAAMKTLNYPNDKEILTKAQEFIDENNI